MTNNEHTVQVPVSLIERIRDTYAGRDYHAADAAVLRLIGLLSQPWGAPAKPLRIEAMAPGTTFEYSERWTVADSPVGLLARNGSSTRKIAVFDPSTIRDMTPPKDAS